jgi:hypothetical protein
LYVNRLFIAFKGQPREIKISLNIAKRPNFYLVICELETELRSGSGINTDPDPHLKRISDPTGSGSITLLCGALPEILG